MPCFACILIQRFFRCRLCSAIRRKPVEPIASITLKNTMTRFVDLQMRLLLLACRCSIDQDQCAVFVLSSVSATVNSVPEVCRSKKISQAFFNVSQHRRESWSCLSAAILHCPFCGHRVFAKAVLSVTCTSTLLRSAKQFLAICHYCCLHGCVNTTR